MSDLSISINPEMLGVLEVELLTMQTIFELATAGANGNPEFDEVLESQKVRLEATKHIVETMKMELAVNNEAKFEM